MSGDDMMGVIEGVLAHSARMLALGWGDSADEVASWFEEPEHGLFIANSRYCIVGGVGVFAGLSDMDLLDSMYGDDGFTGIVFVGDRESAPLTAPRGSLFVADFLRSTLPV